MKRLGLCNFYLFFFLSPVEGRTSLCFSTGIALKSDVLIIVCPIIRECVVTGLLVI